jgi:hypothetical protein
MYCNKNESRGSLHINLKICQGYINKSTVKNTHILCCLYIGKRWGRCWWLTPATLVIQEAEIKRLTIQIQSQANSV